MSKVLFLLIASLLPTLEFSSASTPLASPIALADEAFFLNLLDLTQPALAPVQKAVADKDWPAAKAVLARYTAAATLDLGEVDAIAKMRINGNDVGIVWKPPYTLDIRSAVKIGTNTLEVEVVNT